MKQIDQVIWKRENKINKVYYAIKLLVVGSVLVLTAFSVLKKEKANV